MLLRTRMTTLLRFTAPLYLSSRQIVPSRRLLCLTITQPGENLQRLGLGLGIVPRWFCTKSQPYAKRMSARGYLAAILTSTAAFVLGTYYYKEYIKRPRKAKGCVVIDVFDEPHMRDEVVLLRQFNGNTSCWLPGYINATMLTQVTEFPVEDSDIFAVSFPKSGTTWLQEIIFMLHTDLDFDKAADRNVEERFPFLEFLYPGIEAIASSSSPRLIKSHLPYDFMPDAVKNGRGKVVYIARNPRDVYVSLYHFLSMVAITDYKGTFKDFFEAFVAGKVIFGSWEENVISFWNHRDDANVLFITYEELQKNPVAVVKKIATFLGKEIYNNQLGKIVAHCSFNKMRANPTTNYSWWDDSGFAKTDRKTDFLRKGKVGDWTNYFDVKMCEEMDKTCADKPKTMGLEFVYKL